MAQTSTSIPGTAAGSSSSSASRASGCVIDGIDINTCTDDFKLNELVNVPNNFKNNQLEKKKSLHGNRASSSFVFLKKKSIFKRPEKTDHTKSFFFFCHFLN